MEMTKGKRCYSEPLLEILLLGSSDVITTSDPYTDDNVPDSGWTD